MDFSQDATFYTPSLPTFVPGLINSEQKEHEYLASLDSDTRDYVIKHCGEDSSIMDMVHCVEELKEKPHGEIL